jgi:predicted transcriptional regulator
MEQVESRPPRGSAKKFTDQELREAISRGTKPADFARQVGVSRQAVNSRVKQLQLTTASAVVAPEESRRFTATQIDVMEQLALNLRRANLLMDACDAWLRDADDSRKYDLGPRGDEVLVTYFVEEEGPRGGRNRTGRKEPLDTLLARLERLTDKAGPTVCAEIGRTEFKHADPRELILKTQAECRQSVALFADLIQRLMDAETMQAWREAVVAEVAKESPEVARRINERIRRTLVLHAAFADPGEPAAAGAGVGLSA